MSCQSMSCCSSFYMNSAVGATGVYFSSLAKIYSLAASRSFIHYHFYSVDYLTLYFPAVLVYALYHRYHAFTSVNSQGSLIIAS